MYRNNSLILSNVTSGVMDTGGTEGVQYTYKVKAKNRCNGSDSNTDYGTKKVNYYAPSAPTNFTATDSECASGGGQIIFAWTNSSNRGNPNCTYDIYKGATLIKANATSGYVLPGKYSSESYHVKAVNSQASVDSNTNNGASKWKPNACTNFSASDNTITAGVQCTWTNASDTGSPACTYDLYRNGTHILSNVTSGVTDTTSVVNVQYTYKVRSKNTCGYANSAGDYGTRKQSGPIGWANDAYVISPPWSPFPGVTFPESRSGLYVSGLSVRVGSRDYDTSGNVIAEMYGSWIAYLHGTGFTNSTSVTPYKSGGDQYIGFGAGGQGGTTRYQFRQYSPGIGAGWGTGFVIYNPASFSWSDTSSVMDNSSCSNIFDTSGGAIRWREYCPADTFVSPWTRLQ